LHFVLNLHSKIVSILAFHAGIVDQRPLDIKKVLKSLIESLDYYNDNKEQALQLMSSASSLSKDEIIHGFDSTKLMTLRDNLMSMTNSTGNMSSMYTLGKYASNFFTQNSSRLLPAMKRFLLWQKGSSSED